MRFWPKPPPFRREKERPHRTTQGTNDMKAQPKASHFIDGEYVEDTDGTVIESLYPATGEVIARLHAATPAIVEKAIAAAKRAQPEWAAMSPMARGRILKRAADIMRERNRALSELETLD